MSAEKKQITRNRTSYSCQCCRRRKVKCDKIRPTCGGCQKALEECIYSDADKSTAQQPAQAELPVREDESRKRRAIEHTYDTNDTTAPGGIRAIEQRLSNLTSLMQDLNRLTPVSNGNSPGSGQSYNAGTIAQRAAGDVRSGTSIQASKYGIPNSSSIDHEAPWANVLAKLDQLDNLLRTGIQKQPRQVQGRSAEETRTADQSRPLARLDGTNPVDISKIATLTFGTDSTEASLDEKDIMAPTETESNVLFRSWLFSIHPICPILSPRLVLEKYATFNQWYRCGMDNGERNPDPSFMPYVTLIWYTGYINLSDRAREKWFSWADNPTWIQKLRARFEHRLEVMKSEVVPSIWTLSAAIVGQYLAIGGQDTVGNSIRNTLNIRAAQSLGLHSEKALKALDANEAESKRRLWWEAVSLDTATSTVSGMPVILDEMYTDTKMISELKEVSVGTKEAEEYEKHLREAEAEPDRADDPANCQTTSLVSVYHLVMKARHMLTAVTKKVLKANMSAQSMTMDELKELRKVLVRTSKEVHAIINRIPCRGAPEFDFTPETIGTPIDFDYMDSMGSSVTEHEIGYFLREHSNPHGLGAITMQHRATTIAFHKWSRITLSMLVDRVDCISYSPFLTNPKSRMWAVARNCALKSCHGYMRKFLSLAEDAELRRFRWAWSSTFHPMHATMILLIDLHDRPHSDEAPRSRAMIDRMFSLASLAKGLVDDKFTAVPLKEGGTEAWTMLRKLRHKAWQKAGLDPDVLWSEEDQMCVGIGKPLNENDLFIRSLREDIIFSHKQRHSRYGDIDHRQLLKGQADQMASREHLHPSELGPGNRIEGPIIRDLADLDTGTVMPQVLLLRASHDQELMPFPLSNISMQPASSQQTYREGNGDFLQKRPSPGTEGAEIFHIGELIRKIRASQTNSTSKTLPASTTNDALDVLRQPERGSCNFRTVREMEKAAFEDLHHRHSTPGMLPIDDCRNHIQALDKSTGTTYGLHAVPSAPPFDTSRMNDRTVEHTNSLQQKHSNAIWEQTKVFSHVPSTPSMNSFGYTGMTRPEVSFDSPYGRGFETQSQAQPAVQAEAQATPAMTDSSSRNDFTDADNNTTSVTDVGFDWDKWDEIFGQYGAFEDMLMNQDTALDDADFAAEMEGAH